MTDKITLSSLGSIQNDPTAVATINANNAAITSAMDNTLSRNGLAPNGMNAQLDMNGFDIINLPAPGTLDSPARVRDVASNASITIPSTGTSGHNVPYLDGNNTFSGTNAFSGAVTTTGAVNLTGSTVTVATQTTSDSSTKAASTAFVHANLPAFSSIAGLSVLGNNGTSSAAPAAITGTANKFLGVNSTGTALAFETMSGDATLSSGALTLSTVNSGIGSFGDATNIPTVTVNAKGLVTGASQTALTYGAASLTGTTLATGVVNTSVTSTANTLNLGAPAASPASSAIGGQNVLTGTSNTAGTDFIVQGGKGTGTGAGGSVRISTSPSGSSGTAQNAGIDRLVVDAPGNVIAGSPSLTTTSTDGFLYIPTCAGVPTGVPTSQSGHVALVWDTTNHKFWVYDTAWKGGTNPGAWT